MALTNAEKQARYRQRQRSIKAKQSNSLFKLYQAREIVNRLLRTREFDSYDFEHARLDRLLTEVEENLQSDRAPEYP